MIGLAPVTAAYSVKPIRSGLTMPLTPADVHNMTFQKAGLGKRGYDAEEVDALREEIGQEMIRLLAERDNLETQVRRAGAGAFPGGGQVVDGGQLAAVGDELNRALRDRERAERDADGLQRRLEQARNAEPPAAPEPVAVDPRVLAMAQRTADQYVRDAYQESEQVLGEARERSGEVVRQAQQKAHDIEQAALRRDGEATEQLKQHHAALTHEVAELTEFAETYRADLEGDVRHQGEF